jgi:hypothetical protein
MHKTKDSNGVLILAVKIKKFVIYGTKEFMKSYPIPLLWDATKKLFSCILKNGNFKQGLTEF